MTFTFHDYIGKDVNPYADLISNALKGYQQGVNARYSPKMFEAEIQQKQAASQKNLMLSKLLQSMFGGPGIEGNSNGQEGGMQGGIGGNNLKAAVLKAVTGIDPYLMSPQESQNMKIQGATQQLANKNNLTTGSSDVGREFLQNKVSMPEQYMGAMGSLFMAKDRISAELGDKQAQERLIQAAVAEKLVPEYAGFQLMSQGQKSTKYANQHQQEAIRQGWPNASHVITNTLPSHLQKEAEKRHNEIVKGVNKERETFLTSGGKERHQFENAAPKSNDIKWSDIEHTAAKHKLDPNDVIDKLAKKNGMSVDKFMQMIKNEE